MSAASVSKSYAALLGVQGYMKGMSAFKEAMAGLGRVVVSIRRRVAIVETERQEAPRKADSGQR